MKTNNEKARLLAYCTAALELVAYAIYYRECFGRIAHPNISSWIVWAFIAILNTASYKFMSGDWIKTILPLMGAAMCTLTAIIAMMLGSFGSLSGFEKICLATGIAAGLGWYVFKSAAFAQVLLQLSIVIGGIPTIMTASQTEPWLPWSIWAAMFVVQTYLVSLRPRKSNVEFLYPILGAVSHCTIYVIALRGASANMHEFFSIFAGIILIGSALPYIWAMVVGESTPMRSSWFIWAVVGFAFMVSYRDSGATYSKWAAVFGFFNPCVISLFTLRYGHRGWTKLETKCAVGAILSLSIWYFAHSPGIALIAAIATDAMAVIPTMQGVWKDPSHERPMAWFLWGIGSGINLLAVDSFDLVVLSYPVYMTIGGLFVSWPLIRYHWFGVGRSSVQKVAVAP